MAARGSGGHTHYQIEYLALDGTGPFYMGPHDRRSAIKLFHLIKKAGFKVRLRKCFGAVLSQYDDWPES